MGTTPTGLPYPEPTDPVAQGAAAIKALAEAIDPRWLASVPVSSQVWTPSVATLTGGTWDARSYRIGALAVLAFRWTMGATPPSGDVNITFPAHTGNMVVGGTCFGWAEVRDISPSSRFVLGVDTTGGTTGFLLRTVKADVNNRMVPGGLLSATEPMTWATGDMFYGGLAYLAA